MPTAGAGAAGSSCPCTWLLLGERPQRLGRRQFPGYVRELKDAETIDNLPFSRAKARDILYPMQTAVSGHSSGGVEHRSIMF